MLDLKSLAAGFENCPCGHPHTMHLRFAACESGLVNRVGTVLQEQGFPLHILLVSDNHALRVSDGLLQSLFAAGFSVRMRVFENLTIARMEDVLELEALCKDIDGVLSVGTGSVNDICRLAAARQHKDFAIFATAPSMDGFASDGAPIIADGFKFSYSARQPSIVLADARILAESPGVLKAAGFGDMIAKTIAIADWRISALVTGEYYCEKIAALTREAVSRVVNMADRVQSRNEEAASALFEALLLTGIGMAFTGTSRPASGAEHVVSHFWEVKLLEKGVHGDFHGRMVGVATLLIAALYHRYGQIDEVYPVYETLDDAAIRAVYGPRLIKDYEKMNIPPVTEGIAPETLKQCWPQIREIIRQEIPPVEVLRAAMEKAGAATELSDIGISPELAALGIQYHPFMRRRISLMRLRFMLWPKEDMGFMHP